jgi:hypothetical protein
MICGQDGAVYSFGSPMRWEVISSKWPWQSLLGNGVILIEEIGTI